MEYKLHDLGKSHDFRTKKGRDAKKAFIASESLMITDFFYWYRIKANYRDLDYIDFENGISEYEVHEYMCCFFDVFEMYRRLLVGEIRGRFTLS